MNTGEHTTSLPFQPCVSTAVVAAEPDRQWWPLKVQMKLLSLFKTKIDWRDEEVTTVTSAKIRQNAWMFGTEAAWGTLCFVIVQSRGMWAGLGLQRGSRTLFFFSLVPVYKGSWCRMFIHLLLLSTSNERKTHLLHINPFLVFQVNVCYSTFFWLYWLFLTILKVLLILIDRFVSFPLCKTLKRKEKEYEHEMERLAREKIATQQRLAELKNELSQSMDVVEIDRVLRQTIQPEDDQASTSTASGMQHVLHMGDIPYYLIVLWSTI